jgi:hypothetical protein
MAYTATQHSKTEPRDRDQARKTRNLTEAFLVREAANDLFTALSQSDGIYSTRASHRLLDLCNAIIDLTDGDAEAMRESLMLELGVDEHGNPVSGEAETDAFWRDSYRAINAGLGE